MGETVSPKWLIEKDPFDDGNPEKIKSVAEEMGMEAKMVKYIPFHADQYDWGYEDNDCVIVYGSINLAKYILKKKPWVPGVWCDFENIRCRDYLAAWGQFSVQQNYGFYPLGEVIRKKDYLYQQYGNDDRIFLRPDDNAKSFCGEKVWKGLFEDWVSSVDRYSYADIPSSAWVMVAEARKLIDEWRFVVSDRKIVTGCQYKVDGMAERLDGYSDKAAKFAEMVVNSSSYEPHPIYCIDIASTPEGFGVVEMGAINTCGLYHSDIKKVVESMTARAIVDWNEAHND